MPPYLSEILHPRRALIFRITHAKNLPWLLDNGLHCASSKVLDPQFERIGNPELIDRREQRVVPIAPGGTLADYIPFYFTPLTPMLFNIRTGFGGIPQVENEDLVILVASLRDLAAAQIPFVFTDRHAYLQTARFSSDLADLEWIPWGPLKNRDFKRDSEDAEKVERYQAEALVHGHLPASLLSGVGCYNGEVRDVVREMAKRHDLTLRAVSRPSWYF